VPGDITCDAKSASPVMQHHLRILSPHADNWFDLATARIGIVTSSNSCG
jgi:hypothetical protein